MIHVRIDAWADEDSGEYSTGRIACGAAACPPGDSVVFEGESYAYHVADCPACNPGGPKPYGTPISKLSGRPGKRGFDRFCDIAESWASQWDQ